jgi:hypothetical protein
MILSCSLSTVIFHSLFFPNHYLFFMFLTDISPHHGNPPSVHHHQPHSYITVT